MSDYFLLVPTVPRGNAHTGSQTRRLAWTLAFPYHVYTRGVQFFLSTTCLRLYQIVITTTIRLLSEVHFFKLQIVHHVHIFLSKVRFPVKNRNFCQNKKCMQTTEHAGKSERTRKTAPAVRPLQPHTKTGTDRAHRLRHLVTLSSPYLQFYISSFILAACSSAAVSGTISAFAIRPSLRRLSGLDSGNYINGTFPALSRQFFA